MTRNTERRVEIAVPIKDKEIRKELHRYLSLCLSDNVKARRLSSDGRYRRIKNTGEPLNAQEELMRTTLASKEVIQMTGTVQSAHKGIVFTTRYKQPKKKSAGSGPGKKD